MKKAKKKRLKAAGWKVASAREFLDLNAEEAAIIEIKLALAQSLRDLRTANDLTQTELARMLRSSQSRVAKMEAADASVSIDLLVRALLVAGATKRDVGRIIARKVA